MKKKSCLLRIFIVTMSFFSSWNLFGSETVQFINYYEMILEKLGVSHNEIEQWVHVVATLLATCLIFIVGICYKIRVNSMLKKNVIPQGKCSLVNMVDAFIDFITNLVDDMMGEEGKRFWTLLVGLFIFILFNNFMNLVPGFTPGTDTMNTNLAMGLVVFGVYNYAGIREHKFRYIKQFLGPVWWLAPLMICLELMSHALRPFSLSLRLYANLFGDHLLVTIFSGFVPLVIPVLFLFFGLLVACVQAFVFTVLSSVYISMAISHDH